MKYKTELTNKVQLCFSLRKYQKNLSDNWKVSHQWICADKACILQVELAADTEYSCSRLNLQARSLSDQLEIFIIKSDISVRHFLFQCSLKYIPGEVFRNKDKKLRIIFECI